MTAYPVYESEVCPDCLQGKCSKIPPLRVRADFLAPVVGVKTGGSRVGGPKQCVLGSMVTGDKGHDVLPRFGPS